MAARIRGSVGVVTASWPGVRNVHSDGDSLSVWYTSVAGKNVHTGKKNLPGKDFIMIVLKVGGPMLV